MLGIISFEVFKDIVSLGLKVASLAKSSKHFKRTSREFGDRIDRLVGVLNRIERDVSERSRQDKEFADLVQDHLEHLKKLFVEGRDLLEELQKINPFKKLLTGDSIKQQFQKMHDEFDSAIGDLTATVNIDGFQVKRTEALLESVGELEAYLFDIQKKQTMLLERQSQDSVNINSVQESMTQLVTQLDQLAKNAKEKSSSSSNQNANTLSKDQELLTGIEQQFDQFKAVLIEEFVSERKQSADENIKQQRLMDSLLTTLKAQSADEKKLLSRLDDKVGLNIIHLKELNDFVKKEHKLMDKQSRFISVRADKVDKSLQSLSDSFHEQVYRMGKQLNTMIDNQQTMLDNQVDLKSLLKKVHEQIRVVRDHNAQMPKAAVDIQSSIKNQIEGLAQQLEALHEVSLTREEGKLVKMFKQLLQEDHVALDRFDQLESAFARQQDQWVLLQERAQSFREQYHGEVVGKLDLFNAKLDKMIRNVGGKAAGSASYSNDGDDAPVGAAELDKLKQEIINAIHQKPSVSIDRLKSTEMSLKEQYEILLRKIDSLQSIESPQSPIDWMGNVKQLAESKQVPYIKFDVDSMISRGSFATVYKGTYEGKTVAIKTAHQLSNSKDRREFIRELSILFSLNHLNIVQGIAVCTERGNESILMEYCPYCLSDMIEDRKALSVIERFHILQGIHSGLSYLHKKKVVHADLKSANVLLAEDYTVKLTDFGLSKSKKLVKSFDQTTCDVQIIAPELFNIGAKPTPRSDIFSFGVLIHELYTGKRPFEQASVHNLKAIYDKGELDLDDTLSDWVRTLVKGCLTVDPAKRWTLKRVEQHIQTYGEELYKLGKVAQNNDDNREAVACFKEAMSMSHPKATYRMGFFHLMGKRGCQQDLKLAFNLMRKAAKFEVPAAYYNLAVMYQQGVGVDMDLNKATELFEKGAALGSADCIEGLDQLGFH